MRYVGNKFVASDLDYDFEDLGFFPILDSQNGIQGTQVALGHGEGRHFIQIRNRQRSEFRFSNYLQAYYHYQSFRRDLSQAYLVEVQISDLVAHHLVSQDEYFDAYELNEILDSGLKVILNLVPVDFIGLIARDNCGASSQLGYLESCPLELLDGDTLLEKKI